MPKVSVVIPTYNRVSLISECIESVLRQTYKDFEVIVVDDGSTDDTEEVLKPYHGRIRYIRQENAGVATARNRGVLEATGEYVAFLDSDDQWFENKLELQMDLMTRHPELVMACGNGIYLDGKDKGKQVIKEDRARQYEKNGITLRDAFYRFPLRTSTILIKKDVFNQIGGFNESYRVAEDMHLAFSIMLKYGNAGFINTPLYKLKKGDDNLSSKGISKQLYSIRVLEELFLSNPEIKGILTDKEVADRLAYRYYHLAQAYRKQGDRNEALEAFKKALSYRPFYASCLLQYGLCLIKKG